MENQFTSSSTSGPLGKIVNELKQFSNSTIGSIVLAVVAVSVATYFGLQSQGISVFGETLGSNSNNTEVPIDPEEYPDYLVPSPLPEGPVEIPIEGQPSLGSKDAPVTVVEFTDYECPFCKQFSENIVSEMIEKYVNTGKVRFVIKDFPLSGHFNAKNAAYAANCTQELAGDETYFVYHDILFDRQSDWSPESDPSAYFQAYAVDAGLDAESFIDCYDGKNSAQDVEKDMEDGAAVGVNGTPIFFVNGEVFLGLPPAFDDMAQILDDALAAVE